MVIQSLSGTKMRGMRCCMCTCPFGPVPVTLS